MAAPVVPSRIEKWSLSSLQQWLVKTGGRLIKHARYSGLLLADRESSDAAMLCRHGVAGPRGRPGVALVIPIGRRPGKGPGAGRRETAETCMRNRFK